MTASRYQSQHQSRHHHRDGKSAPVRHDHVYLGEGHDRNMRRTLWVVALTLVMMVAEIIAGLAYGSMALLADGVHMGTHAGALGLAAFAYHYAKSHAHDPAYSFGTGKIGDLAAFASAVMLGLFALGIGIEAVERLFHPVDVRYQQAVIVAVIGLIVNVASAWMLMAGGHDHHHGHHGHDHHHDHDHGHSHSHDHDDSYQDNNMRAALFHILADALTSVMAILALLAGAFWGWVWLDALIAVAASVLIARWSWGLMRESAAILLDTQNQHLGEEIGETLTGHAGIVAVNDLHIWRVGGQGFAAIIAVKVQGDVTRGDIAKLLSGWSQLVHITIDVQK